MATLRQLPSGSWNAQVRIKGQPPQSKTFKTQGEAHQWAIAAEVVVKQGPVHTVLTLGLAYCESVLKGRGSYEEALRTVRRLGRDFPMPIHDITPQMVNAYKLKRLGEAMPATVRGQLAFLSRFFRFAQRELMIDIGNPVDGVSLPKPSKPSDKVVTRAELETLMADLSPMVRLIVEIAYETAMRRSEIIKLKLENLHLEDRLVDVVDGKNGTRSVPLTKRAVTLFEEAIELAKRERIANGRLFNVLAQSVSQAVRRSRERIGLPSTVRFHQLRHTRITNVAKKGFNNAQIMIVSGHRDTRSVARYSHLNAKDVLHLID